MCRAIISSSLVGITHAETLLCGVRDPRAARRHSPPSSSSTPSHADASADPLADLGRVLADAGGEHERVDPAEDRGQRADLLRRAVDEVVHGQAGLRLAAAEQVAHVVADAGNPEQPGLLVEDVLDLLDREPELLEQIQHDAGVERARPGAHAQPVHGREAHRGVDALAVLQRAQAGAAAQVRDDDPPVGDLGRDLRQDRGDVLVGDAVEAVPLDAALAEFAGQRHQRGDRRVAAVKAGVEAGHLRHVGHAVEDRLDRARGCAAGAAGPAASVPSARPGSRGVTTVGPLKRGPPWTTR